ncbi:protein split ends-like isoform X1 [Macrobrachium rosenbergii]|uniref:protein split ends-like isoform X1 n=1 Tax=Macrobrachium rosenbergii TaxID=79674 RepID=UPI0034D3C872
MENVFHHLTISLPERHNMAKRPNWDFTPHHKVESPGDPSTPGRLPKLFARDDYGQPSREPALQPLPGPSLQTPATTASPLGNFNSSEFYNDEEYLTSLLFDYGLQLSPGGTHIEHDPAQFPCGEAKPDSEQDRSSDRERTSVGSASPPPRDEDFVEHGVKATTLPHSKFRKITQFSRSSQDKDEGNIAEALSTSHLPSQNLEPLPEKPHQQTHAKKKVKKYEFQQQFDDPEEERKRLNAINARKNRMKQKALTYQLKEKAKTLEDVNQKCGMVIKRMDSDARKLKQQLEDRIKEKAILDKALREKELEIRDQREKLVLFRGHLDLIASSLEDDNPGKRLISNLLKKLPVGNYPLSD